MRGLVVASQQVVADAGAAALAAGGTAVDAAVAAGLASCVADQANAGLGGYGGYLVYAPPEEEPVVVDFNTWVPARVAPSPRRVPGDLVLLAEGGASVAPPQVVPGLLAAQERFGRLPRREVVEPAVRLAAGGVRVSGEVARALERHRARAAADDVERLFAGAGERAMLVQEELAGVLAEVADRGVDAFRSGPVVDAICERVRADGGFLEPGDFEHDAVAIRPAASVRFRGAVVHGPPAETSGAGVVFDALHRLDADDVVGALRGAWAARTGQSLQRHTTTLCAAHAEGGLVSLTFTQGGRVFGSGLVAAGVVLNCGATLFAAGPDGPRVLNNMSPVVVVEADGTRHALGATGGPRIPSFVAAAVVDVVARGRSLAEAVAAPRVSVRALDGAVEAEPGAGLAEALPLRPGDFGPANGITMRDGAAVPAADPRFEQGIAAA